MIFYPHPLLFLIFKKSGSVNPKQPPQLHFKARTGVLVAKTTSP
jgi:hypothetical protein